MFEPRVLTSHSFPDRFATWGLPFVWTVVYVQQLAPFLTPHVTLGLTGLYVALCALYGVSRPLTLPAELDARFESHNKFQKYAKAKKWCVSTVVRLANTFCDGACAALSIFFVKGIYVAPLPYFGLLLVLAVALHCFVEMHVQNILRRVRGRRRDFGGRGFEPEEVQQLVSVETVVVK